MSELVSVILTTFNNPFSLYHSLNSVLRQTYKNIEILIVDGGDMKMTKKIVDHFTDKRITYIKVGDGNRTYLNDSFYIVDEKLKNRICGNVQYCRNIGVTLAQGKFVAMLDDDDRWEWTKIEKQIAMASMTGASLVACRTIKLSGMKKTIDIPPSNPRLENLLQTFNFSQTSAYFMKKKDLVACGGFNENLRSMHEYDVALRMAQRGYRIATVDKALLLSCCDNTTKRSYYFTKMAETLDFWRCYGRDMVMYLHYHQFVANIAKTVALLSLYAVGYIVKDKVWGIIFKLKHLYQERR